MRSPLNRRESADSLQPDESCVAELMNVAWAKHEMTSQFAAKYFDFCEKGGPAS